MLAGCAYPVGLASSGCTEMETTPWPPCSARTPAKNASSPCATRRPNAGTSSSTCARVRIPSDEIPAEVLERPDPRRAVLRTPPADRISLSEKDR
jgi:hypothetical protein